MICHGAICEIQETELFDSYNLHTYDTVGLCCLQFSWIKKYKSSWRHFDRATGMIFTTHVNRLHNIRLIRDAKDLSHRSNSGHVRKTGRGAKASAAEVQRLLYMRRERQYQGCEASRHTDGASRRGRRIELRKDRYCNRPLSAVPGAGHR